MARSTFVYVIYIRTTPEKRWSALTDVEFMKQYWFGTHCESRWTPGSSWKHVSGDGQILDAGEIVEAEPPRRLVIRWQNQLRPEPKATRSARWNWSPVERRSSSPLPTLSSANPRLCWRAAPSFCRSRTRWATRGR